jgi:chromosome segregation ATPase
LYNSASWIEREDFEQANELARELEYQDKAIRRQLSTLRKIRESLFPTLENLHLTVENLQENIEAGKANLQELHAVNKKLEEIFKEEESKVSNLFRIVYFILTELYKNHEVESALLVERTAGTVILRFLLLLLFIQ